MSELHQLQSNYPTKGIQEDERNAEHEATGNTDSGGGTSVALTTSKANKRKFNADDSSDDAPSSPEGADTSDKLEAITKRRSIIQKILTECVEELSKVESFSDRHISQSERITALKTLGRKIFNDISSTELQFMQHPSVTHLVISQIFSGK